MQTFLPYQSFPKCARLLDDKRLYKQIVECKQILNTLEKKKAKKFLLSQEHAVENIKIAWENHPAVLMWEGHEAELRYYQWCMFEQWAWRRWGFDISGEWDYTAMGQDLVFPSWVGDERIHKSHRAKLFYKNPEHYALFKNDYFDLVEGDCVSEEPEYFWPVKK